MAPALLFRNRLVEVGPHVGDFFEPVRSIGPLPVAGTNYIAELAKNEFGVADQGDLRGHMKADPRRRGVGLDVASAFIPSGAAPNFSPLQNRKPIANTTSARPVNGFFHEPRTASGWSSATAPCPARRV